MKKVLKIALWCIPVLLMYGADAQSLQTPEQRKALLQRTLEEKGFHRPGTAPRQKSGAGERVTAYDQRVTTNAASTNEGEVSIAYDPADSNNLVLSFMQEDASGMSFPIYFSSNGGSTWSRASFSSTSIMAADFPGQFFAGGGDPAFAWDKNGKVYFSWIYLTTDSSGDTAFFTLNWAYSTNAGHTWSVTPKHFIGQGALGSTGTSGILNYKDGVTDREWLAVDNSGGPHQGNIYCSFVCFPGDSTLSTFEGIKVLQAGADSFGAMVQAYVGSTQFGNVEVDHAGVLHMSFGDLDNEQVRHVASTNGGLSFGASQVIGNATVLFPTGTFVVQDRENAAPNLVSNGGPAGSAYLHAVWSDYPGGIVVSYYSHSSDGGLNWSTPTNLNSSFPGRYTIMPTVAAQGPNVAISLTVIDSVDSARYYQLNSTDNGSTFDTSIIVSSVATNYQAIGANLSGSSDFFGDYNRSARTQCMVSSAWADGRLGLGAKMYFARANYCNMVNRTEVSSITSSVQVFSVFPNPAPGAVTLQVELASAQGLTVEVTDMAGRSLLTRNYSLPQGLQQIPLALGGVTPGAYLITVRNNEGLVATRTLTIK